MSFTFTIEEYSPKSFVVRGNTKPFKEELKKLKGRYNPHLKNGGPGWIFSNKRQDEFRTAIREMKVSYTWKYY
jgi:hypothetical protein